MKKNLLILPILAAGVTLGVIGLSNFSTTSKIIEKAANADETKMDLVSLLAEKTISEGKVSFVKEGYTFSFYASGATFNKGSISLAAGGYLQNITAYNGMNKIDFTIDKEAVLRLGTGTADSVSKESERTAETGTFLTDATHFRLVATEATVVSKLDLNFSCSYSGIVTDESTLFTYDWDLQGLGTESNPYIIANDNNYKAVVEANASSTLKDLYFKLDYNPVVTNADATKFMFTDFAGHFDGNNKTFTMTDWVFTSNVKGLFAIVEAGFSCKNLTIEGSMRTANTSASLVGQIKGNSTIEGIVNNASITSTNPLDKIGGIVANCMAGTSTIKNCINNGDVTGKTLVGGIVGVLTTNNTNLTIDNCVNNGAVSALDTVGGIVGRVDSNSYFTIKNSTNNGSVTSTNGNRVGGIAGCLFAHDALIEGNTNLGAITSKTSDVGGFFGAMGAVGTTQGYIANYTFKNNTNGSASDSSKGRVLSQSGVDMGGFIGYVSSDETLINVTFSGDKNYGTVGSIETITNCRKVGGFVGASNGSLTFASCVAEGRVTINGVDATENVGCQGATVNVAGLYVGWIAAGKTATIN